MRKAAALLLATALASLPAMSQEMRPGKYKTVTKMDMGGRAMPPQQDEDCVTKADIDEGLARMGHDKEATCKPSDIKRGPGTASYKVTCAEDGVKTTGEADIRMTPDSFDFNMTMKTPQMGPVKANVRGTRMGECRK
jgi:hypothetical protein